MNYHQIETESICNGIGIRTVLWVSGCNHNCKGCHNPQTHDVDSGILFDDSAMNKILDSLIPTYVKGITYSGGDPLHINNRYKIAEISSIIRKTNPDKDQWLYTGYKFEQILSSNMKDCIRDIDILIDGKFIESKKDLRLKFRGSSNQRIIDVQRSLKKGRVILYEN